MWQNTQRFAHTLNVNPILFFFISDGNVHCTPLSLLLLLFILWQLLFYCCCVAYTCVGTFGRKLEFLVNKVLSCDFFGPTNMK